MKRILFYAVKEDLLPVLELVESKSSLKYALTGNFLKSEIEESICVFDSGAQIPHLGTANADSAVACDGFLVCERATPINLRTVGQHGERVCVDQLANPESVTLRPGGIWHGDVLLHGTLGTASNSPVSQSLMKRFHAAIKKTFSKVQDYYVGPEAYCLLERGWRLTAATQSPPECDLRI
jgi:hypothetical protein